MTRLLTASMRRMNRMMRPAKLTKATRSIQNKMTSFMVKSALAPLVALAPKVVKSRKATVPKAGQTLKSVLTRMRAAQSFMPETNLRSTRREVFLRIPGDAKYLTRRHRSAAGSRGYKLFIPASQPKRPTGLILMLHGCKQTPDDFAIGTHMNALAEKHGMALAYPEQTRRHNAISCWNWFKPGNQMRGMGEPAILAALTRKLMREFGLDRERVFVAGLSAGGAMATILADVYPDVFSAAGVHSGLARGAAHDLVSAMTAMRSGSKANGFAPVIATRSHAVRWIIFQGENDSTIHPSNAAQIVTSAVDGDTALSKIVRRTVRGRAYSRSEYRGSDGMIQIELWMIEGAGHAWSGGRAAGSFTDTKGPDASAHMVRFFLTNSA